jgi:hypothetical protein
LLTMQRRIKELLAEEMRGPFGAVGLGEDQAS